MGPSYRAPRTGAILERNEVVTISEAIPSADGCVYLRLADGRGWIFDDSGLLPHNPSVRRGHWRQATASAADPLPPAAPITAR